MRAMIAIVALALCAGSAVAVEHRRWVDASGQFSLAFEANGWFVVDADGENGVVAARDGVGSGFCQLSALRRAGPFATREQLNDGIRRIEATAQEVASEVMTDVRTQIVEIDGVAVLDETGRYFRLSTFTRRFGIYHSGETSMYRLSCSVDAADTEGVVRMQAVASSLSFSQE